MKKQGVANDVNSLNANRSQTKLLFEEELNSAAQVKMDPSQITEKPNRKRKKDLISHIQGLNKKSKMHTINKSEKSPEMIFDNSHQKSERKFEKKPVKDLEEELIRMTSKKNLENSMNQSNEFLMNKALDREQILRNMKDPFAEPSTQTRLRLNQNLNVEEMMTNIQSNTQNTGNLDETMNTQTNLQSVARNYMNLDLGLKGLVDKVVQKNLQDSKKEQTLISEALEMAFGSLGLKTQNQRNCLFFQEMMKAMPSQKKTWTRKVKNFFSSKKLNNLKSYRTLALEMVQNLEVSEKEMGELEDLIEEYRIAKALYYSKYMIGWSANLDVEQDEKESLMALINSQTQIVDDLFNQKMELQGQYTHNLEELKILSGKIQENEIGEYIQERATYSKVVRTVKESEESIPLESLDMFKKGSTVYKMVQKFNDVNNKYWKWTFIMNSLKIHFHGKSTDSRARYKIHTNKATLQKLRERVDGVRAFFKKNSEELKNKLIKYLEEYVNHLKETISEDNDYKDYSNLIVVTAEVQAKLEDAQSEYLDEKMRLEEIKYKIQKLEFTDNFDYVFPSGLILNLQKKLRELTILIDNINQNENYFSLDDSDVYLTMIEEKKFTTFFRKEAKDVLITKQRVSEQLKIALEIDEIEGKIDFYLGKMVSVTQKIEHNKFCFSLPDISYFIFLLLKTNVIAKQTKFFDGFFAFASPEFSKEYIVFNYTLFAPTDYVQDLTDRNRQAELDGLSNTLKDIFINDFKMNFTIMINFYKDMTEFGTAENGIVKRSWGFVKSILNLIMTSMDGQMESMNEKGMEYVVDFVTEVITGALSFLTVLPFAEDLVSKMVEPIVASLFEFINVFFPEAYQYFHRAHEGNMKSEINMKKKHDFLLDFDLEIERLLENKKAKKSAGFNKNGTMQMIEKKFLDSMSTAGSIFLKIQNLKIFREKDYQEKVIKMLEKKNTNFLFE
jgi:hypothetical protein